MDMTRGSCGNGGRGYPVHHQRHGGPSGVEPPTGNSNKVAYHHHHHHHHHSFPYGLQKSYPPQPEDEDKQQQQYLVPERLAGSAGGDKLVAMYSADFKQYMTDGDRDREYISSYDKYGLGPDKADYNLQMSGGDKSYPDYVTTDKSHIMSGGGGGPEDKQIYHSHHQQSLPPAVEDGRLFQSRDGAYGSQSMSLDPRLLCTSLAPSADLRSDSLFLDSGPADLTMASKDLISSASTGRSDPRPDLSSLYCNSSPPRHHVPQYRHHQRQAPIQRVGGGGLSDPGRLYPPDTGRSHHFVSPRSTVQPPPTDLYRDTARMSSQPEPLLLEDSAYRSLQDLGYAVRPANHYYDQIDTYFHPASRSLDLDEGYEKQQQQLQHQRQPKYPKHDKYFRTEEGGGRQEGGLLPPLLALVPSLPSSSSGGGHSNPPSASPPMKLDYMCNPGDHMSSQYMPEGSMDYY
jgi:hypothetical protein